jgi:signal peptidase I
MSEAQSWSFLQRFLIGKHPKTTLIRVLILVGAVTITYLWVVFPFQVSGDSMLPTLLDGQVRAAWRVHSYSRSIRRGDVVLIDIAGGRQFMVKRIVALPNERFAIKAGVVLINGQPLDEPYLRHHNPSWAREEIQLAKDEYFFIGDNRTMDMASHTATTVLRNRITGRVIY